MKFSIFLLAIFLFASCATSRYSEAEIERFKKIENPLERWKAHNIHNYNFQISPGCFCTINGNYRVAVRNDKVVDVLKTHNDRGEELRMPKPVDESLLSYFRTFDGYYQWFDSLYVNKIEIKPDSIYGYPKSFYIDFDEGASDDEIGFAVTAVQWLK